MRTSILVLLIIAMMAVSDGKGSKKSSPVKVGSKEKESTKGLKLLTKEETSREKEGSKKERKSKEETRSRSDEYNDNNSNVDKSKTRSKGDGIELKSLLSSSRRTSFEPAIVSESPIIKRSLSLAGSLLNPANLVKTVVDAAVNLYCSLDGRLIPCKDAQGGKYLAPLNFRCRALADVIFVVDSSGSIGSINFKKQLSFIANIAASFFVGANDVRVGLVVFSTDAQIWFDLKEYTDLFSIQKAILETPYEGEVTYTDKALKLISSSYLFESFSGGRDNAPDIVVILTDGQSTNPFATLSEANKLKSQGVTMLSIGITSGIKETELLSLASRPEFFFKVEDFDVLNNFLGQIVEQTCQVSEGVKVKVQTKSSVTEQEPQYYEQEPAQYNEQEPAQYNEQEPAQYNEQDPFYYQEYEPTEKIVTVKGTTKLTTTTPRTTTTTRASTTIKPTTTTTTTTTPKPTTTTTTTIKPKSTTTTTTTTTPKPTTTTSTTTTPKPTTKTTTTPKPTTTTTTTTTPKPTTTTTTTTTPRTTTRTTTTTTTTTITPRTTTTTTTLPPPPKVIPCRNATKADILLLIDASTSIGSVNWQKQVKFAAEVVQAFTVGPRDVLFGTVIFNRVPTRIFDLKTFSNKTAVSDSLLAITYPNNPGTHTHLGFAEIRTNQLFSTASGGRPDARDILIVMTDGQSNYPDQTSSEAQLLKNTGVTVISVGIGVTNTDELHAMASKSEYVFTTGGYEMLDYIKRDLVKLTCDGV